MSITLRSWKRDDHNPNKKISPLDEYGSTPNHHGLSVQRIIKERRINPNSSKAQKRSQICFRIGVGLSFFLLLLYLYNSSSSNYFEKHPSKNYLAMKSLFSPKKSSHILRKRKNSVFPPRQVALEVYDSLSGENVFPISRRSIFSEQERSYHVKKFKGKKVRLPYMIRENRKRLGKLKNTDWYHDHAKDPLYEVTEDGQHCVPMHKWQTISFPTCSIMHELSLSQNLRDDNFGYITQGGYNTVFWIESPGIDEVIVLKILTYDSRHTDRNLDRVRRDAIISERLTASPHVMSIYGHCGHALLVPYSPVSLSDNLPLNMTKKERFQHASTVIYALADAHNINGDGISSVAHGDLKLDQFNKVGNNYQLSDFNRGRFLRWDERSNKTCSYTIGNNDNTFRSPEEYKYLPQNAAIDIWALGNIIFKILTNEYPWPYGNSKQEEVQQERIINGKLPKIPPVIANSTDPINQILIHIMYEMCFINDPIKRATAVQIADYMREQTIQLESHNTKIK